MEFSFFITCDDFEKLHHEGVEKIRIYADTASKPKLKKLVLATIPIIKKRALDILDEFNRHSDYKSAELYIRNKIIELASLKKSPFNSAEQMYFKTVFAKMFESINMARAIYESKQSIPDVDIPYTQLPSAVPEDSSVTTLASSISTSIPTPTPSAPSLLEFPDEYEFGQIYFPEQVHSSGQAYASGQDYVSGQAYAKDTQETDKDRDMTLELEEMKKEILLLNIEINKLSEELTESRNENAALREKLKKLQ